LKVLLNNDNEGAEGGNMPGGIDKKVVPQGTESIIFF
jgi:hypothetical protein